MPRKDDPQEVKDALQARDIELLQASIKSLEASIEKGFQGVHTRQDTTNGRISTNEKELASIKAKFEYNRIIWYLFTIAISIIIALGSYILFNH